MSRDEQCIDLASKSQFDASNQINHQCIGNRFSGALISRRYINTAPMHEYRLLVLFVSSILCHSHSRIVRRDSAKAPELRTDSKQFEHGTGTLAEYKPCCSDRARV